MKIKVQVVIESDGGDMKTVENIACLERGTLQPVELGLTLDEAKDLLESMQHTVVEQQVAKYLEQQAHCPGCGKKRRRKGNHNPIVHRTLFGKLRLPSTRFFNCGCHPHTTRTFSPLAQLLTERTAPGLLYLETKFAALASYGMTVKLLQEVLPLAIPSMRPRSAIRCMLWAGESIKNWVKSRPFSSMAVSMIGSSCPGRIFR